MGRSKTQKFSLAFCSKESGSLPTMDLDSHDSAESVGIQPTLEASAAQRLAKGQGANLSAASYLHNFQTSFLRHGILRKVVLSLCDPLDRFEKRLHGNLPRNGSVNDTKLKEVFYSLLKDAYSGPGMELRLNLDFFW